MLHSCLISYLMYVRFSSSVLPRDCAMAYRGHFRVLITGILHLFPQGPVGGPSVSIPTPRSTAAILAPHDPRLLFLAPRTTTSGPSAASGLPPITTRPTGSSSRNQTTRTSSPSACSSQRTRGENDNREHVRTIDDEIFNPPHRPSHLRVMFLITAGNFAQHSLLILLYSAWHHFKHFWVLPGSKSCAIDSRTAGKKTLNDWQHGLRNE